MTQARATELPATVALTNLTPNRTPSNRNCVRNQMIVEYVVSAFLKLPIQCICIYRTQVLSYYSIRHLRPCIYDADYKKKTCNCSISSHYIKHLSKI